MIDDEPQGHVALDWWGALTDADREAWSDKVGRMISGTNFARRETDIAKDAYAQAFA